MLYVCTKKNKWRTLAKSKKKCKTNPMRSICENVRIMHKIAVN